jgi:hypothetical protein
MPGLTRYWGYLLFVLVIALWLSQSVGPFALAALGGIVTLYFLFQAPVWCGVDIRKQGETCRNNASGILMGCHLRQHKWQKLKMAFVPTLWSRLNQGLWNNPKTGLTTLATIVSILTTLINCGIGIVKA